VSRELRRNGGYDQYRAALADKRAWNSARRPKRCKLARHPPLTHALEHAPASLPRLHPNLAQVYYDKVGKLTDALNE